MKFTYSYLISFLIFFSCSNGFSSYEVCKSKCEKRKNDCFTGLTVATSATVVTPEAPPQEVAEVSFNNNSFSMSENIDVSSVYSGKSLKLNAGISAPNDIDIFSLSLVFYNNQDTSSVELLSGSVICTAYLGNSQFNPDAVPSSTLQSLGNLSSTPIQFTKNNRSYLYLRCSSGAAGAYSISFKNQRQIPTLNGSLVLGTFMCLGQHDDCQENCQIRYLGGSKKKKNNNGIIEDSID
ncbi:hypothetical protein [Leptospira alstonii]|uniref:hypothetical protein n=1 Tax=Leptospira alstonii TaxID=28452 RepID=UPI0009EA4B81